MSSLPTVERPATSRRLTTLANIMGDIGISDEAQASALLDYASTAVSQYLGAATAKDGSITIALESLSENIRQELCSDTIYPGRFPIVVGSARVLENGVVLVEGTDFELIGGGGLRRIISQGLPFKWQTGVVQIAYDGGWVVPDMVNADHPEQGPTRNLPETIEMACRQLCQYRWSSGLRDPSIKSETDVGVYSVTYVDSIADAASGGSLPPWVRGMLEPYRRIWIG